MSLFQTVHELKKAFVELTTLGNEGWDYNTTSTYFKKATNTSAPPQNLVNGEHATYNPKNHGTSGVSSVQCPMHVQKLMNHISAHPHLILALV